MTVICWNGRLDRIASRFEKCHAGPKRQIFDTAVNHATHVEDFLPSFFTFRLRLSLNWMSRANRETCTSAHADAKALTSDSMKMQMHLRGCSHASHEHVRAKHAATGF